MSFPTMWYVRPAKPQISLRIRAVWSESLLVAWVFYDCKTTDWTPFGVYKLKRRLHMLVWVYTRQYATSLEITYRGSNLMSQQTRFCFLSHNRKFTFQTCVHSYTLGIQVYILVWYFIIFHMLCMRKEKALPGETTRMPRLAWALGTSRCENTNFQMLATCFSHKLQATQTYNCYMYMHSLFIFFVHSKTCLKRAPKNRQKQRS